LVERKAALSAGAMVVLKEFQLAGRWDAKMVVLWEILTAERTAA
jgi:hypothetical protein